MRTKVHVVVAGRENGEKTPSILLLQPLNLLLAAKWFMLLTHNSISKSSNPRRRRLLSCCWQPSNDSGITNIPSRNHTGSWETGCRFCKGYVSSWVKQHLKQTVFFFSNRGIDVCVTGQEIAPHCAKGTAQKLSVMRNEVFTEPLNAEIQSDEFVPFSLAHSFTSLPASANQLWSVALFPGWEGHEILMARGEGISIILV